MKKIVFIFGIVCCSVASAQQLGQYGQYFLNPYLFNPAATGMHDHLDIGLGTRKQWAGFDQSPFSTYLTAHSPIRTKAPVKPTLARISDDTYSGVQSKERSKLIQGVGGQVHMDRYGAFSNTSISASYALHIPMGEEYFLSFGLSTGVALLGLDQTGMTLSDPNDQTYGRFTSNAGSRALMDLNAGVYFHSDRLEIGYATNQLLMNRITFGDRAEKNRLKVHHFMNAGYRISIGEDWAITPGFMLKYMQPAPLSYDLTARVDFRKAYWLGVSVRPKDALVFLAGATIKELVSIGYAYEYTISGLNGYNSGTHDVVIKCMLLKPKS